MATPRMDSSTPVTFLSLCASVRTTRYVSSCLAVLAVDTDGWRRRWRVRGCQKLLPAPGRTGGIFLVRLLAEVGRGREIAQNVTVYVPSIREDEARNVRPSLQQLVKGERSEHLLRVRGVNL